MEFEEQDLLEEALAQLNSLKIDEKLSDDILICECMCVSVGMIREKFIDKEIDLSVLSECYSMGSGCSSCLKSFKQWKDKI